MSERVSTRGLAPRLRLRRLLRPIKESCLIVGKRGTNGFWVKGKCYTPRVAIWRIVVRRVPKGRLVSTCGTPMCCNVEHLRDSGVNPRRGKRNPRAPRKGPSVSALVQLTPLDLRLHRHLIEVECPICGGPPTFGTCISCEGSLAA